MSYLDRIAGGRYTFRVDLTDCDQREFERLYDVIDNSTQCLIMPGSKILQVYWKGGISLEKAFNLPPGSVSPWRGSK